MDTEIHVGPTMGRLASKAETLSIIVKFILIVLFIGFVSHVFAASVDVKTYIPPRAFEYMPIVKEEQLKYFPDHPRPEYFPALGELESCLHLMHKRCWSPTSQLKSKREEGAGIFQITRAYNADGSLRFDSLKDMATRHKAELKELEWENVYVRPDLQIRTMILMTRDNYNALYSITDSDARIDMSDAAYNGGLGGLQKERRACGLKANCDPQIWFGNVEKTCLKSTKPLYANRSACDINRQHVHDVRFIRMPKYKTVYQ